MGMINNHVNKVPYRPISFERKSMLCSVQPSLSWLGIGKVWSLMAGPVKLEVVICGNDELKWADHEEVKCFFKSPIRELHQFLQHNDCNLNEILFVKCKD